MAQKAKMVTRIQKLRRVKSQVKVHMKVVTKKMMMRKMTLVMQKPRLRKSEYPSIEPLSYLPLLRIK